jgi:hypothetical protein
MFTNLYDNLKRINEEIDPSDIFKPWTDDEKKELRAAYLKELGFIQQPNGDFINTKMGYTISTEEKFSILSHSYESNVFKVEKLREVPQRASSFKNVVNLLKNEGVVWVEFSQLKRLPPEGYGYVNSGLQAVGFYKNSILVMLETKVGVRSSSSGYLLYVGKEGGSGESVLQASTTATSSGAALGSILTKLKKV